MPKKRKIILYTKFCYQCSHSEEINLMGNWCQRNSYKLIIKRTAYWPSRHREAVKLWGDEYYPAFVKMPGEKGKIMEAAEFAKKCKNKLAKAGKKKGQDDLQGLSQGEGAGKDN